LRLSNFLFALIAFATIAANLNMSDSISVGNADTTAQNFQVAANVISFAFALFILVCYLARDKVEDVIFFFPILEWVLDAIALILVFLSSVMSANRCAADQISDEPASTQKNNVLASVVFGFFNFFVLFLLNLVDYQEHKEGEQADKAATRTTQSSSTGTSV